MEKPTVESVLLLFLWTCGQSEGCSLTPHGGESLFCPWMVWRMKTRQHQQFRRPADDWMLDGERLPVVSLFSKDQPRAQKKDIFMLV